MRPWKNCVPFFRPTQYIRTAVERLPIQTTRNMTSGCPVPRPARNPPKSATTSAGTGGNTFSTAAIPPTTR